LQSSTTSQTLEGNTEKSETQPKEISKCQLRDKGQLAKFLSYRLMTDVRPPMEEGKAVDGFHRSIFHSITGKIMNWSSFPAFPHDNDDERMESIIE
jgi:5-deoxy-D-glucuronate isomerase